MCKIEKWLMFVLCLLVACSTFGQVVPVEMAVSFSRADAVAPAPANATVSDTGDVWIFVLDHSGSMADEDAIVHVQGRWSSGERKTSRWNALLDSFQATLSHIEPGAIVQVVRVSDEKAELIRFGAQNAMVILGDRERNTIYKTVEKWGKPAWRTPLWHGLFLASQEAKRFISTENRNVGIIVFSDGKDESDNGFSRDSLVPFQSFFNQDEFTACLTWINSKSPDLPELPFGPKFLWAKPPQSGNVVPVVCRVRPEVPFVSVRNPLSGEGRTVVPVVYSFPLSEEKWNALLETGFEANLQLVSRDGQVVGGEAIPVGTSQERVVFRIPESSFQGQTGAEFSLRLDLPQTVQGCRFVSPRPVRLAFEKQGGVTISEVKPQSGLTAKVGEAIQFAANGTPGAMYEWTFGDGSKDLAGQRVTHAYASAAPDGIEFTVTAKKAGLRDEKASGTVTVLEAGVALEALPTGLKVGDSAEFRCRGTGEVASYDWFVDGAPAAGAQMEADGRTGRLTVAFDRAGRHTVRVRANMKRVSPEETPETEFEVGAAPYAAVTRPEPNETFEAEAEVALEARVEGGATAGIWYVASVNGTPLGEPIAAPVVDGIARGKFPVPAAGGTFTVAFEAGEGADAVRSAPVRFAAKSKDVRMDVVSPVAGATVKTGEPAELRVASKGVSGVVEFWVEAEGAKAAKVGEAKVAADGTAAVAHAFPAKDGQGTRTLTARSADGATVSDPVEFTLETPARLTLKKPAQNASVAYGGTLEFEAETDGAIEAGTVRWFLRPVGGTEEALADAKGARYEHRFGAVPNRKSVPYEVYARAPLPDGTELETDHAMVRAECPALAPRLLTAEKVYETGLPVTFRAEHAGTVGRVTWDFGDGGSGEGSEDQTAHTFDQTGPHRVRATLTCATCGEEASAETTVELRCPDLSPRLDIVGESSEASEANLFARGKPIRMSVTCEGRGAAGRVTDVAWTFGDGEGETGLDTVNHSYRDYGEQTVTVSVKCSACDREEKATRTLRIDKVPPKAHFKICRSTSSEKSIGGWVAQGTTIALVDQDHGVGDVAHSTGDVAHRRWSCDGEPIPGSEDRNIVEWDCRTVGKHVFELTVFDPLGEPAAPESHSVRVYRLWLICLLLLLAAGASGWAWWFWSGDDPRFWKVGAVLDPDARMTPQQAAEESVIWKKLKPFWLTGENKAVIPLHVLAGSGDDTFGKGKEAGRVSLEIKEDTKARQEGDTRDRQPSVEMTGEPDGMSLNNPSDKSGLLWQIVMASPVPGRRPSVLWLRILQNRGTNEYLWLRMGLVVLFFVLAAAGCAMWGM